MSDTIKYILSWVYWPFLVILGIVITGYGFAQGHPVLFFNIAYIALVLIIWHLELFMPHEKEWLRPDGQNFAAIAHTISSKGSVQVLLLSSGVIRLSQYLTPASEPGYGIWPRDWPIWVQVIMGLAAAEFGLYWAHRWGHENKWLWQFHAVHHSVTKLWFLNTGRFHFIDSLFSILLAMGILLALGAPMEVVKWTSAITAFIGILTHCNVETRSGWLSFIFNTPKLHRWHHSKDLREGNKNYGENLMIWDLLFGTYFDEDRRPPKDIGISDFMPPKFTHQLLWPFLSHKARQKLYPEYTPKEFVYYKSDTPD